MHLPSQCHHYALFGLRVASALDLPELPPAAAGDSPDLVIRRGSAGDGDGHLMEVPAVARFRISEGRSIVVEPAEGADPRDVRLFLLGSAMGIALHQRSMLPLHANAVAIGGKAVAFMGPSGSGKSTLAAWFHDNGHGVLADDVCVITFVREGEALAYPGLPRLRLWQDALEASGRAVGDYPPSFRAPGDSRRKYDVAIRPSEAAADPLPLGAMFVLQFGPALAIERLGGAEAVEAISANTYRGGFVSRVGDSAAHFRTCLTLARTVPVFRFVRPTDRDDFDRQCRAVLDCAERQLTNG